MPKISAAGATDKNEPGYFEPGRSHHSPNVHGPEAEPEPEVEAEEKPAPKRRTARRK